MPRNSGGTYSLPAGNPVVTATVISSSWANTTMADLRTALTDSLDRSGRGGMLAQLALFAGTIGAPSLSWTLEPTSGLYRAGAGDFRFAIGGVDIFNVTASGISELAGIFTRTYSTADTQAVQLNSAVPALLLKQTTGAANNQKWLTYVLSEQLRFSALSDTEGTQSNWLTVDRTGIVIDSILLAATTIGITGTLSATGTTTLTKAATTGLDGALFISSTVPLFSLNETDGAANNRLWTILANAERLQFDVRDDTGNSPTAWLQVDRTGTVVDSIALAAAAISMTAAVTITAPASAVGLSLVGASGVRSQTITGSASAGQSYGLLITAGTTAADEPLHIRSNAAGNRDFFLMLGNGVTSFGNTTDNPTFTFLGTGLVTVGGNEVGWRNIPSTTFSTNSGIADSFRGTLLQYTGTGHTLTVDNSLGVSGVFQVVNEGSGNLSIVSSGITLAWLSGSGVVNTGTRTLAIAGACTIYKFASGSYKIWGTGLS